MNVINTHSNIGVRAVNGEVRRSILTMMPTDVDLVMACDKDFVHTAQIYRIDDHVLSKNPANLFFTYCTFCS